MFVTLETITFKLSRCFLGPTPDSMSICGEPTAPADRIISLLALTMYFLPFFITSTPSARLLLMIICLNILSPMLISEDMHLAKGYYLVYHVQSTMCTMCKGYHVQSHTNIVKRSKSVILYTNCLRVVV